MLSAKLGHFLDKPLTPVAKKINVNPNILTISGFVISVIAAFVIPYNLRAGGILIIVGGLFDMFDGIVARINGRATDFGAYLDSILDRYADAFIFLAIAWYLVSTGNHTGAFLSIGTMVGAFLISYARARAEGLGKECHTGLMERPERVVFLAFGTISGWLVPVLWLMLILTHVTVIQRIYHVWRLIKR